MDNIVTVTLLNFTHPPTLEEIPNIDLPEGNASKQANKTHTT